MIRLAIALFFICMTGAFAQATPPALRIAMPTPSSYIGPGDIEASGSTGFYLGLRAWNNAAAVAHTAAAELERASDDTTKVIDVLSSGEFDTATATTFCTGTTCSVIELYDQTGNGHNATQATLADAPTLTFNCLNTSLPCMSFSGSQYLTGSYSFTPDGSYMWTAERTNSSQGIVFSGGGFDIGAVGFYSTANTIYLGGTAVLTLGSVADNAWHAMQAVMPGNSGTSYLYADGTGTNTTAIGSSGTSTFTIGASPSDTDILEGGLAEVYYIESDLTTAQIGQLCHNQYQFWATSVSC